LFFDLVSGVHNRGVVFLAEFARDLGQRCVGKVARQIHRDLARYRQALVAALALKLLLRDAVEAGHLLLNEGYRYLAQRHLVNFVAQHIGSQLDGQRLLVERRVGSELDERAFQLTYVGRYDLGNVRGYFVRYVDAIALRFLPKNRFTSLKIRRLDVGEQSPFEPRPETILKGLNVFGRTIA
jgi:hypothetical protein